MSENLTQFAPRTAPQDVGAAIYTDPDEVVADPGLTKSEKRAILASWVSDARAVEDAPTLRRLESGAVVEVAAVLDALRALDGSSGVVVRLPAWRGRQSDPGDDDPPSTPARSGIPPLPIRVDAYGGPRRFAGGYI